MLTSNNMMPILVKKLLGKNTMKKVNYVKNFLLQMSENISLIKPSYDELLNLLEDEEFSSEVLSSFNLQLFEIDESLSILQNLVYNTSFNLLDFAGINFFNKFLSFREEIVPFASYYENLFCLKGERFVLYNVHSIGDDAILYDLNFDEKKFLESMLLLIEIYVDCFYKGKSISDKYNFLLAETFGDSKSIHFFREVLSNINSITTT